MSGALLFLVLPYVLGLLFLVPETPTYLWNKGREKEAARIVERLHGEMDDDEAQFLQVKRNLDFFLNFFR